MNIQLPESSFKNPVYFIGDQQESFIEASTGSYIVLNCKIRSYSYKGGNVITEKEAQFKLMTFQGEVTFYLGDYFKPYFTIPKKLSEIIHLGTLEEGSTLLDLYKPLEVDIVFKEYNYYSNELLSEQSFASLYFIPGRKDFINLFSPSAPSLKASVSSLFTFSQFIASGDEKPLLSWYKNKEKEGNAFSPSENMLSVSIYKNPSLSFGDWLEVKDEKEENKLFHYVFPSSLTNIHLFWLDENLCLRNMVFTGSYQVKYTHSYLNSSLMQEGRALSRNIEDLQGSIITVNSGFLQKEDLKLLNSLLASEKTWVSMDGLKNVYSFSFTTEEFSFNSEDSLFYFDLEMKLNKEKENHTREIDDPNLSYNFIFNYKLQNESILPNCTEISLENVFDTTVELIDWGDGSLNNHLTHTFEPNEDDDLTIKVKIKNPTKADFSKVKYIFEIIKMPSSLVQMNFMGCLFTEVGIERLFDLVLKNNLSGSLLTTYATEARLDFQKYIHIGNQFDPVTLPKTALDKAKELMDKNWHIDYFMKFDASGIPTNSRYQSPEEATKLWPQSCNYQINVIPPYALVEDKSFKISVNSIPTGTNINTNMLNYFGVFLKQNTNWNLIKDYQSTINNLATTTLEIPVTSVGSYQYRVGQQKIFEKSDTPDFGKLWSKDIEVDVLKKGSAYWKVNEDTNINFSVASPNSSFFIFPLGANSYTGVGISQNLTPSIENRVYGTSVQSACNNHYAWKAAGDGDYRFKLINFTLDFTNLSSRISDPPTFYLGYLNASGNFQLAGPSYPGTDGRTVVNKEIELYLTAGTQVVPLFAGIWKTPMSNMTTFFTMKANSRFIVEIK